MKKIAIALMLGLALAGCSTPQEMVDGERYSVVCIDGVSYLFNSGPGGRESITVKIDGDTLQPETCTVQEQS